MILALLPLLLGVMVTLTALTAVAAMSHPRPRRKPDDPVTILVCARDEELGIELCLLSLAAQTYPAERMKLLLVDHLSTDRTGEIMDEFAVDAPFPTEVIHIHEDIGPLHGKVQALDVALERVTTEYVLLTDGDCIVPPTWVATLLSYFEDDVAVVNGHVNVEDLNNPGAFTARMQHALNRMFLALSVGYSALQMPPRYWHWTLKPFAPLLSRMRPSFNMGNNQGLRMSVYRAIGGFRQMGPSLIEDVALVNRILRDTHYRTAVVLDPRSVVTTLPSENMREFWHQARRWTSAMDTMSNKANAYLYFVVFLMRVGLPWSALLNRRAGMAATVMVAAAEYVLLESAARRLGERTPPKDVVLHWFTQLVMNHLLMIAVFFRWPVIWKGQVYEVTGVRKAGRQRTS